MLFTWLRSENWSNRISFYLIFQGRKAIRKHLQLGNRKSLDMRSQLGEMISGIGSNRQEMLRNRSKAAPPSPNPDNNRKWHKTSFLRNNQLATGDSLSLLGVDAASANSTIVSLRNQGILILFQFHVILCYNVKIKYVKLCKSIAHNFCNMYGKQFDVIFTSNTLKLPEIDFSISHNFYVWF